MLVQDAYQYDLAGNRTSEQIGLSVKTATYNNLNQLTGTSGGGPLQFTGTLSQAARVTVGGNPATVDASNNFSGAVNLPAGTNVVAVVATDYSGNAGTNRYQVVVPSNAAVTPAYDLNGNLTNNGAGQTYEWDAKDELTAINYSGTAIINGVTRSTFAYDGLSRRVKIVEKAGTTVSSTKQFVWVGDRMAEERDASGNLTKRFFALGEQISGTTYYLTHDHLGSIRELTNSSGTTQARYDYDPYGRVSAVGTITTPSDFQYAGMYAHPSSLLNLTKYRAYDPNVGRWLSRDLIGENGGINLYEYAGDNTMDNIDPLGLISYFSSYTGLDDSYRIDAIQGANGGLVFALAIIGFDPKDTLTTINNIENGNGNLSTGYLNPGLGSGSTCPSLATLKSYPKLAGKVQDHHIQPKYLRGDPNGPTVPLDAEYHQNITNEFRNLAPYGQSQPSSVRIQQIMNQVYTKFPLPE